VYKRQTILYVAFHFFGNFILNSEHRWVPIPPETIARQSRRIEERGWTGIFVGRLTPFIRGYVAVISGLLHVQPRRYGLTVLITSSIWACFYITFGYFLGPYWQYVMSDIQLVKMLLGGLMVLVITIFVLRMLLKRRNKDRKGVPSDQ
jgi:membrane protein DedA with SNARE-associated domain